MQKIIIENIEIEITKKKIKNIHLKVFKNGIVKVSLPNHIKNNFLEEFLNSKINWIKEKLGKFENIKIPENKYENGEIIYFLGEKYFLKVFEAKKGKVEITENNLNLFVKTLESFGEKEKIIKKWQKEEFQKVLEELFSKWEKIIGVKMNEFRIKQMKTKWGTCNVNKKRIWMNLELIKKPKNQIEYVVIHELVHLIEASHNHIFKNLMTKFCPNWKELKKDLNNSNMQNC